MSLHTSPAERRVHTRILRDHRAKLPKRIPTPKRERIEAAIEAHLAQVDNLIGVLDRFDGDVGDYEPSVGHPCQDDREVDVADEPHDEMDEGNNEAWLAHTNDINQERATRHLGYLKVGTTWVTGSEDLEAEHDGREDDEREGVNEDGDDCDLEPNLSPVF